jgi:phospholipid/cholesterol/gamma-HCH transport system substrate-binding protein
MRRIAATLALLAAAALAFFGQAAGGSGGDYKVRAIFDNGNFLVPGEAVRVAGANVGSVSSVDVTMPGEQVHSDGKPEPGKAVVVLAITDAGFQDFRQDASCLIRPQSLLGEKYIDCEPTQPRPPGSALPPPLKTIPDGQPGAGERFLPLENNGQEVDLDLINNIMREPFADRFRLILNDLGAGLAARGKTLDAIIARADPALRQTDRVLAELRRQNRTLAKLAVNGDTDLAPLARERQHLSGFINNANTAAEATAERSADLEAGFQKFPEALRQLRLEMAKLRGFSDQATPVLAEFGAGAPGITRATKALGPFAHAATPSLITLGKASAESKQPIANSDPMLIKIRDLAKKSAPSAKVLDTLLASFRKSGFYRQLTKFLFYTTGGINGYDQYGHFLRAVLLSSQVCTILNPVVQSGLCEAHFYNESPASSSARTSLPKAEARRMMALAAFAKSHPAAYRRYLDGLQAQAGAGQSSSGSQVGAGALQVAGLPLDAQGDTAGGSPQVGSGGSGGNSSSHAPSLHAARALLDTLIGPQQPSASGGGQ